MDLQANADRFSGADYIAGYDQFRPKPPAILIEQALTYLGSNPIDLVVDLGCGTGLSTLVWNDYARQIIGIEPSEDMVNYARKSIGKAHASIQFAQHFANDTPIESESADIVTCSQSFHWMEPVSTIKEVDRILKKGGLFMVYDCTWPPAFDWALEKAYQQLFERVAELSSQLRGTKAIHFSKQAHLANIKKSGRFQFVKEAFYHHEVAGGLTRFEGIARSQGGLQTLLNKGYSKEEIGLVDFENALSNYKGDREKQLTFYYKVIFAKK